MSTDEMRAAASKRAEAVRAPADRPRKRRCAEDAASKPLVRATVRGLEVRESSDGGALTFEGYASVTEHGYEMWDWAGPYTEVVRSGAFAESLARADLDVPLVLAHDSLRRIARTTNGTLTLTEDDTGLHVLAQLDPADADVAYIAPKLRSGLVDEMSFMFSITAGQWSPDWMEYDITKVDIHRGDTAIVGYGANPATAGSGLRTKVLDALRSASDAEVRAEMERRGIATEVPVKPEVSAELRALLDGQRDADMRYANLI